MKRNSIIAMALAAGIICSAAVVPAAALENDSKVRVVIENNTLSEQDGADWSGTLLDTWVSVDTDTTLSSVLETAFRENDISQEGLEYGFITSVNGLSAEDGGSQGGWLMTLDHWMMDEALTAYTISNGKLEAGDVINLVYSCSWGADIGYDWSGSDTSLSELNITGCTITPQFSSDCFEYTATLDEGSDIVTVDPRALNCAYRTKVYKNEYTPAQAGTDIKFGEQISVANGDVLIIGVANEAWMQANYNNAQESIYKIFIDTPTEQPDVKVQETESLINAIGTVTKDSGESIKKARAQYDALSDEQKAKVTNYSLLEAAEGEYAELSKNVQKITLDELIDAYKTIAPKTLSFGSEWDVINLARLGLVTDQQRAQYADSIRELIKNTGSSQLSATRTTVNSGVAAALTSLGINAKSFYGSDIIEPLYDLEPVINQGINGAVYALIAFDLNKSYQSDVQVDDLDLTHEKLLSLLLMEQQEDGGWTIDTWSETKNGSDADMTAMVLQAFAPYYKKYDVITGSVDKALSFLSSNQNDDGAFRSYGSYDCESCAQVITALCSLGIDPENDQRFIKNGKTAYDGLISFCLEDRTFSHLAGGDSNALSTTQAYTAIASLYRFRNEKTSIFDMNDLELVAYSEVLPESSAEEPVSQQSTSQSSVQPSQTSGTKPESTSKITPNTPASIKTGDNTIMLTVLFITLLLSAVAVFVSVKSKREK